MIGWKDLSNLARLLVVALVALMLLGAWWFFLVRPGQLRREAVNAKADSAYSTSSAASAKDAVTTISGQQALDTQRAKETQDANEAIDATKGASTSVAADTNTAGLRALCVRKQYRDSPRCRALLKSTAP